MDSWELEPVIFFYVLLLSNAFVTSTSFSGVDVCGASVSPGGLFVVKGSLPERESLVVDDLRKELDCCRRPSPISAPATGDTVLLSSSRLLFLLFCTDLKVFGG